MNLPLLPQFWSLTKLKSLPKDDKGEWGTVGIHEQNLVLVLFFFRYVIVLSSMGSCLSRMRSLEQGLITVFLWRYRPVMRNSEMELWYPPNTAVTCTDKPFLYWDFQCGHCGHLRPTKHNCICTPRRAFIACKSMGREVENACIMSTWSQWSAELQGCRILWSMLESPWWLSSGACMFPTLPWCHQLLRMFKSLRMKNRRDMSVQCM